MNERADRMHEYEKLFDISRTADVEDKVAELSTMRKKLENTQCTTMGEIDRMNNHLKTKNDKIKNESFLCFCGTDIKNIEDIVENVRRNNDGSGTVTLFTSIDALRSNLDDMSKYCPDMGDCVKIEICKQKVMIVPLNKLMEHCKWAESAGGKKTSIKIVGTSGDITLMV